MAHQGEASLVAAGGTLVQLATESSKPNDSTTGAIHVARAPYTHIACRIGTGRGSRDPADAAWPQTGELGPGSRDVWSPKPAGISFTCSTGSIATRLAGLHRGSTRGARRALAVLVESRPGGSRPAPVLRHPGHKADFGVMLAGPDLKAIHGVQTAIQSSILGPALVPAYSFYSITEVSEYVPDVEEYGGSSANARGWTPRAACTRPRSPPMPSGWSR